MVDNRGDDRGAKETTKNPKPPQGGSGTAPPQSWWQRKGMARSIKEISEFAASAFDVLKSSHENSMSIDEVVFGRIVSGWNVAMPFFDQSPVDEDWIVSMGGVRTMQTAGSNDFAFGNWQDRVSGHVSVGRVTPLMISLRNGKKRDSEIYVYGVLSEIVPLDVPTKSKIMMLLNGLGIRSLAE